MGIKIGVNKAAKFYIDLVAFDFIYAAFFIDTKIFVESAYDEEDNFIDMKNYYIYVLIKKIHYSYCSFTQNMFRIIL